MSYPAGNPSYSRGVPTVKPAEPFIPEHDAEVLRRAMKGLGTDEDAIINVLCNRTNSQRQEIAHKFKALYNRDLTEDLKSELSGNFEEVVLAMMTPTAEYQAKELHHALKPNHRPDETNALSKPWETNKTRIHGVLVEVMGSATNHEIHNMRDAYQRLFSKQLEDDLKSVTGSYPRLLESLIQAKRTENYTVDHQAAVSDAKALQIAREEQMRTGNSQFNDIFIKILSTASYPQLKEICKEYYKESSNTVDTGKLTAEVAAEYAGLQDFIASVVDSDGYFAQKLYNSMKGLGTRDRALRRIITLRSEIDMADIKQAFSRKFGKSLEDFIEGDTSGDAQKCLIALMSY